MMKVEQFSQDFEIDPIRNECQECKRNSPDFEAGARDMIVDIRRKRIPINEYSAT
jgi:hypothetical protein